MKCPCCNQDVARIDPARLAEHLPINGQKRVLLTALAARFGCGVRTDALVNRMYSGVRDGGPDNPQNCLTVYAYELRKKLRPFGLTIDGSKFEYVLRWLP